MNTAVLINLDYLLSSQECCEKAWRTLYMLFMEAGFELHERLFLQAQPADVAIPLAEKAMRLAAEEMLEQHIVMADVVKSCHAFEYRTLDLLELPRRDHQGVGSLAGINRLNRFSRGH